LQEKILRIDEGLHDFKCILTAWLFIELLFLVRDTPLFFNILQIVWINHEIENGGGAKVVLMIF
jgi:hypothetical protein